MNDRMKNFLELLIFGVILISLLIYYGVNKSKKNTDKSVNENKITVQTASPATASDAPLATPVENAAEVSADSVSETPDLTGAEYKTGGSPEDVLAVKADEYHSETEEGVQ